MRIERVQLMDFRNYERADFAPCDGVTVLTGDNAQGKTNMLEAMYLCCTGRSHRTQHDREMIRRGADAARVHVECVRRDGPHDVEMLLSRTERRRAKVGGSPVARSGELLGHVTGVLFSPEDLRMVRDGPAERRRFIDMELSQLRPAYYYALQKYARALKQRASLLRQAQESPLAARTLDVWDEPLAEYGAQIMEAREKFVEELSATSAEIHAHVTGGAETLSISYAPNAREKERDALKSALAAARDTDIKRQMTTVGPHRDDIRVTLNGMDARAFGSQGQVRTCALSMKLSELEVMRRETGESPLLMLDDVMSELDPGRRRLMLKMLTGVQTILTCTDLSDLAGAATGKIYRVRNAILEEELHP